MEHEDTEDEFEERDFSFEEDYMRKVIKEKRVDEELINHLNRVFHEEKESIKQEKFRRSFKAVAEYT